MELLPSVVEILWCEEDLVREKVTVAESLKDSVVTDTLLMACDIGNSLFKKYEQSRIAGQDFDSA